MKAVILAAGKGTRLYPLTDKQPKCMVKIQGKPLLDHQIEVLLSCGVNKNYIVAGHLAHLIKRPNLRKIINKDYATTNMVYTLFCASQFMTGEEDILVIYGDVVYTAETLQSVMSGDAPINVGVDLSWRKYWQARMNDPLKDAETLRLRDGNRITELGKRPKSYDQIEGQYMGLIKIRADYVLKLKEFWEAMDRNATYENKDFENMYFTSFLQALIDNNWDVRATLVSGGWLEIDTHADLTFDHSPFWTPHPF